VRDRPHHEYGMLAMILLIFGVALGIYFFNGLKEVAMFFGAFGVFFLGVWLYWKIFPKKRPK
jgi:hypothetical protein